MSAINSKITEKIRSKAKELLASEKISAFVGFTDGTLPMISRPFIARNPEDVDRLVFNSFCVVNPAVYLPPLLKSFEPPRRPTDPPPEGPLPKVGILATGCWSRNILIQVQENQIARERVIVLGTGCRGMVDIRKVQSMIDGKEIEKAYELDDMISVSGKGFSEKIPLEDVLRDNCLSCIYPNPVIMDYSVGDQAPERKVYNRFPLVDEIESRSSDQRWEWFQNEISSCIRCYACRNVCPLCYCPTCFVDDSTPQWVGKSLDSADTSIFHILRAFHCAGRCTNCGSCETVCPMGINMRVLTSKLTKDVIDFYGTEAGLDKEAPLPLTTYGKTDQQDFMVG